MNYPITDYQAVYLANMLTRRLPANDINKLTASLQDAQVDLTPHQVEAALFAFKSLAAPIKGIATIAKMLLAAITLVHKRVAQEASAQTTLTK